MLSDATIQRMKAAKVKVKEFMDFFQVNEDRAWVMVLDNDTRAVAETAMKIDQRQAKDQQAKLRSMSAELNTYKSNIAEEEK